MKAKSLYDGLLFPKGSSAKLQREERRKEIKALDREFQADGPKWCQVGLSATMAGHYAEQACWHHLLGRRHLKTRWDKKNCLRVCMEHHKIIHDLGPDEFYKRYFIGPLPL